jgi:hypothetical protein
MENTNNEPAFKDFKNAISIDEFESVLNMAKEEYRMCTKIIKAKEKFQKKTQEGIEAITEQSAGMPPGLAKKLIQGLQWKANNEALKGMKDIIDRHVSVTDFINRFQTTTEVLPYLDFNFTTD